MVMIHVIFFIALIMLSGCNLKNENTHKKTLLGKSQNWDVEFKVSYNASEGIIHESMTGNNPASVGVFKVALHSPVGVSIITHEKPEYNSTVHLESHEEAMKLKDGTFFDYWDYYQRLYEQYPPYVVIEWVSGEVNKEEKIDLR